MAHRYDIRIAFQGGLTGSQQTIFETAAEFWSRIITADVPPVQIGDMIVDDVLIFAQGTRIDGEGGILGQAWPIHLRLQPAQRPVPCHDGNRRGESPPVRMLLHVRPPCPRRRHGGPAGRRHRPAQAERKAAQKGKAGVRPEFVGY